MGVMCSWVAVQGGVKAEILEALKLAETGEEVIPGEGASIFCCCEFPGDWLVIFSDDFDWAAEWAEDLSEFGLAVGVQCEDKAEMTSAIWAVRERVQIWRVFHDNKGSIFRLDVTGDPPAELAEIRDRLVREQEEEGGEAAGVDLVWDIPLELSKAVCGFRIYEGDEVFIELQPPDRPRPVTMAPRDDRPRPPGFWARLFGRR